MMSHLSSSGQVRVGRWEEGNGVRYDRGEGVEKEVSECDKQPEQSHAELPSAKEGARRLQVGPRKGRLNLNGEQSFLGDLKLTLKTSGNMGIQEQWGKLEVSKEDFF